MPEVTPTSDFESIALRGGAVSKSINRWFQSFIDSMQAWMQVPPLNYTLKKKKKNALDRKLERAIQAAESWKGLSKQQGALCAQDLEVRNSAGYAGASGSPGTKLRVLVEEIMLERGEGPVLTASR